MAAGLEDGAILLPSASDLGTPNAALVVGNLNGRRLQIDFMDRVLGVDDSSIEENFVAIEGVMAGKDVALFLMHPLDCVRSRLANVNVLHRHDDHSVRQAAASIVVLGHFIDDLLQAGNTKAPQRILKDLQFVVRDCHLGKASHVKFGDRLDPIAPMERYVDEPRLHERWRGLILSTAIARLREKWSERLERIRQRGPEAASSPEDELEPAAPTS